MTFSKTFGFSLIVVLGLMQISRAQYTVRKIIHTDLAPSAPSLLSQAIQVDNIVYVSGNLGMNLNSTLANGITNQTRLALDNIGHILTEANSSFDSVIKVTVLLSNITNYDAMNNVYMEYFTSHLPARAAYQVANLPRDALVEIELVAVVGDIIDVN